MCPSRALTHVKDIAKSAPQVIIISLPNLLEDYMFRSLMLSSAFAVVAAGSAFAGDQYVDETNYALSGYDPVAYFSLEQVPVGQKQPEAIPGKASITADYNGSTEYIKKMIAESPAGSVWAVGTEISLVNRLSAQNPDKTVFCLDSVICPCSTMYRIHPAYVSWVLDGLNEGVVVNRIEVAEDVAAEASVALDRMLAVI